MTRIYIVLGWFVFWALVGTGVAILTHWALPDAPYKRECAPVLKQVQPPPLWWQIGA
jgi:hypothetical protein